MADIKKMESNLERILELRRQKEKASAYAIRQIRSWTEKKKEKDAEFDKEIAALEAECAEIVQAEKTSYVNEQGNVRVTFVKDSIKQVWDTAKLAELAKNHRTKISNPEYKKTIPLKGGVRFKYE